VIGELLASLNSEVLSRVLAGERERRAREIARAETALRSIERLMNAGTVFPYDVSLREEPAQALLFVEGTTPAELHVPYGRELASALLARLDRLGRRQIGPVVCVMPPAPDDMLILQMGTPIVDPPAGEPILMLPAGAVVATRHVGPYEEIGLAEHTGRAFGEEQGLTPAGPLREVYRNDPARVAPEALETDVLLPVTRTGRTPGTAAARR
jgi:hypothetical protein